MRALAGTVHGVYEVDVETGEVLGLDADAQLAPEAVEVSLPRVVSASAAGATVAVVVDRRPPLAVSHDAGATWRETGGGLPPGRAVAVDPEQTDRILYASRNRLYVSEDGGVFWRALALELPEIDAVAWET